MSQGGEDMQISKRLAVLGLAVLTMYLAAVSGWGERLRQSAFSRIDEWRMRNVTVSEESDETPPLPRPPRPRWRSLRRSMRKRVRTREFFAKALYKKQSS